MNIGIVSTWFERGAAYVSRQYVDALKSNKNNHIFVYARGGEAYAKKDKVWNKDNITWGKRSKKYFYGATSIDKNDFIRWINKQNIEIILFNEQNWWEPVLWCKEMGIIAGTYVDYYTEITVPFFHAYDFVICNTKRHYSLFKDIPQSYYIRWGTDIELFNYEEKEEKEDLVFFHSAGMNPTRKGTGSVIQAFNSVCAENSKLIIHTQEKLDDYLNKNICSIAENNPDISIINKTVAAPGLYSLGDVYVYPSILDGLGLSVVEALSCGLPCIVSNNEPMNEFINNAENGRLTDIEYLYSRSDGYFWPQCKLSQKSLEDNMRFYVENRNKLKVYQKQARISAEEKYNWKERYQEICSIFENVKARPIDKSLKNMILKYEKNNNGKYNIIPYAFYYWKKWKKN
ncbi:MAG: glycosyltransferase family 4 protein [Tannerella sp.]|jgi:glycosyltransferase involved in cell wall biosynthesis|nr:glycosyltransferase family 4 protein [Tannerella sp.]